MTLDRNWTNSLRVASSLVNLLLPLQEILVVVRRPRKCERYSASQQKPGAEWPTLLHQKVVYPITNLVLRLTFFPKFTVSKEDHYEHEKSPAPQSRARIFQLFVVSILNDKVDDKTLFEFDYEMFSNLKIDFFFVLRVLKTERELKKEDQKYLFIFFIIFGQLTLPFFCRLHQKDVLQTKNENTKKKKSLFNSSIQKKKKNI